MAELNKPSQEELKAKEDEAIALAEELEGKQQIPQDINPEDEERARIEAEGENSQDSESPALEDIAPEADDSEQEPQAEPSKEIYKKKFSESSREAQKLSAKNRVINRALIDAEEAPEPTEEELAAEFDGWDVMTDTEKGLAKETVISRRWRQTISKAKEQATKIEKWNDSVEDFLDDPKTLIDIPALEGKEEDFREFATKEENNSVPFKTLVGAFLYERSIAKKPHKGRMFENGSGGPNDKPQPKSGKISLEDARKLRESNYDKWKEYNSRGLIDYNL